MRNLNAAAVALQARLEAGEPIPKPLLLEVHLSPVQYLTTAGGSVTWGGHSWKAVPLEVEAIQHGANGEVDQLAFMVAAITEDQIQFALEPVEGALVRVYDAWVNPDTGEVVEAVLAWSGSLNVPTLADGVRASVSWTAEHRAVRAYRPKPSTYSNDEQQRLYPGDTSLNVDPQTDAAGLAWPAASYFKQ